MVHIGYVYVVILREFVKSKEEVIKFGCTKDYIQRYKSYPKGSLHVFSHMVKNYKEVEKEVLKKLRDKFIQRKDIGHEYFEGCIPDMLTLIQESVKAPSDIFVKNDSDTKMKDDTTVKDVPKLNILPLRVLEGKQHNNSIVRQYVNEKLEHTQNEDDILISSTLFENWREYAKDVDKGASWFKKEMQKLGFVSRKYTRRDELRNKHVYHGLRYRDQ